MHTKEEILQEFKIFQTTSGGIGEWIKDDTPDSVFEHLGIIEDKPLSVVHLNQLLGLGSQGQVSDGFYRYYWMEIPERHPYDLNELAYPTPAFTDDKIGSLSHLMWGLYRVYLDGLLYLGNVRTAYRELRQKSYSELCTFFEEKRIDTDSIERRGPALELCAIPKEERHLVSELACKTFDVNKTTVLRDALTAAYKQYESSEDQVAPSIKDLLDKWFVDRFLDAKADVSLCCSDILNQEVDSREALVAIIDDLNNRFVRVRENARQNTNYYLSMVNDMDVYVATSMRSHDDFLNVASFCESVFTDSKLDGLHLRHFDPTMSAAEGHEDKGIIECLMVKCAKALVFCAGEKDSFGKDSEAAMALSLGHPVIFFCDDPIRRRVYRDIHPLSRLIEISSGVAVGAIIAENEDQVTHLLQRLFQNKMRYRLENLEERPGYLRLVEEITGSIVRLQTNDQLLTETFWNHYHGTESHSEMVVASQTGTVVNMATYRKESDGGVVNADMFADEDDQLVRRRARTTPNQIEETTGDKIGSASAQSEDFPMSYKEMYVGFSGGGSTKTAESRANSFHTWASGESLPKLEAAAFIPFVLETIEKNNYKNTFTFSSSDLTRWFSERKTQPIGSKGK